MHVCMYVCMCLCVYLYKFKCDDQQNYRKPILTLNSQKKNDLFSAEKHWLVYLTLTGCTQHNKYKFLNSPSFFLYFFNIISTTNRRSCIQCMVGSTNIKRKGNANSITSQTKQERYYTAIERYTAMNSKSAQFR